MNLPIQEKPLKYISEVVYILDENKKYIAGLILAFIFIGLIEIIGVSVVGVYLSVISGEESLPLLQEYISINTENSGVFYIGIALVIVYLIKSMMAYGLNFFIARYGYKKQTQLRNRLLHSYSYGSFEDLNKTSSSVILNEVMNYASNFTLNIAPQLLRLFSEFFTFSALILYLTYISPISVLIIILLFGILMVSYDFLIKKKITTSGRISKMQNEELMSEIGHTVKSNREIRVLGIVDYFLNRFFKQQKIIEKHQIHIEALQLIPRYMFEVGMVVSIVLISFIFVSSANSNILSTLGMFAVAGLRIMPAIINIVRTTNIIRASRHVVSSLNITLRNNSEKEKKQETIHFKNGLVNKIKLENVSYKYSDTSTYILKNISLNINKGDCIGISGHSGSGKSTLVGLILGILNPTQGKALACNVDTQYNLSECNSIFAYIPQEVFIFDDSIATNIAIGVEKNHIDINRLKLSIEMSQIDFISSEKDLFVKKVGEDGSLLSGGQRQRIALARMFYHERDFIVLDEITSSLDKKTEKEIIKTITRLKKSKTFIIVSHSSELMSICDKVYNVKDGVLCDSKPN